MGLVKKNWHEDVMAALVIVREEVGKATQQIEKAGGAEMSNGNRDLARKALGYCDKLDEFMVSVEQVGEQWEKLRKTIDDDEPDVQEVVLPTKVRQTKGGFKRDVKKVAPWTNFTVQIDNGELIQEPTAKDGFAKSLAYFDLQKVADCGVMMNGEPLLSRSKADFKKYPSSVAKVRDGWFVSTYCSTQKKCELLKAFAKKFGVKVLLNVVPHKIRGDVAIDKQSPIAKKSEGDMVDALADLPVGKIVKTIIPELFRRGCFSKKDVEYLQTKDAARELGTDGASVLKLNVGRDSDRYVVTRSGKRNARYYAPDEVSIQFEGTKFYLSHEFKKEKRSSLVAWIEKRGIAKKEIRELVEQKKNSDGQLSLNLSK